MRVNELSAENFRNYSSASVSFSPGINIITGENAQGKTNLLEAVYYLSAGRSFRSRFDRELIRLGCEGAAIRASISSYGREQSLDISLTRGKKKQIRRNGAVLRPTELAESLSVVLFSPEDLDLIRDGAAARRRMMDAAISLLRPGYARLISEYGRLLEHKTRILRDWREKPSLLDTLDDFSLKMCAAGAKIIRYRASFVQKLAPAARAVHRDFSRGREELDIAYKTVGTVQDPLGGVQELFTALKEHQAAHRQAELASQSCLSGVHKDDLEIGINGLPARTFASQGQTRTAALSLKLAERELFLAETGENPVLLLDDVLSELDALRQEFVLNRISGGQIILTCCESGEIARRTSGTVFTVSGGSIRPL